MKLKQPEASTIIFFEPDNSLFLAAGKLLGDDNRIFHAHDPKEFRSIVEEETNIALIIATDETEAYDTLEIMQSYQHDPWFDGTLSVIVAKKSDSGRKERAEEIGIQDYLDFSAIAPGDHEMILKHCISRAYRLTRKLQCLKMVANYDGLTGFYNHAAASEVVTRMLQNHPEQEFLFAIIDIDYFKQVNDVRGHEFGDWVLKEESDRIRHIPGVQPLAIRYGGDEFMLLVPIVSDTAQIAQRIYEHLRFTLEDYPITNSIGIATTLSGDRAWESLFRQADQALYTAKANGRNQYCVYSAEMSCKLDGVGKEIRSEKLNLGPGSLIHALVNGFQLVCHLDLQKVAVTKLTKIASGEYGWSDPIEYIPFIKNLLESVEEKHQLRFSEFINPNTLSGRLAASPKLTYFFAGTDGKEYRAEYLAGDRDESGQITNALLLLNEVNRGEKGNDASQEEATDVEKCLAGSLTAAYNAIWIVHPGTLARELVSIQTDISRHRRINRVFEGGNYWEDTQGYLQQYVGEAEREGLLKALHPDVVLREVEEQGMYTLSFHRRVDGITHRCEYTFTGAVYGGEKVILQLYRRLK